MELFHFSCHLVTQHAFYKTVAEVHFVPVFLFDVFFLDCEFAYFLHFLHAFLVFHQQIDFFLDLAPYYSHVLLPLLLLGRQMGEKLVFELLRAVVLTLLAVALAGD